MINLLLKRRQRRVRVLADLVDAERQLLRDMRHVGYKRLEQAISSDTALLGFVVGGFLTGRYGKGLLRPLKAIPFIRIAKKLRPYLPIGF